jgi:hypothetical protein
MDLFAWMVGRCTTSAVLDTVVDFAPHASRSTAKGSKTGSHGDNDQRTNQPVFDRRGPTPIAAQPAQNAWDSDQASLLWSTSTKQRVTGQG